MRLNQLLKRLLSTGFSSIVDEDFGALLPESEGDREEWLRQVQTCLTLLAQNSIQIEGEAVP